MNSKYFALGYQIGVDNVPTAPPVETQEKEITVTENGTTEVTPDEGKLLAKVTVTTDVVGGGGGGGSMEGFHKVQFFNDDQTTLLYTVFVPHGASAIYAGETPVSTEDEMGIFEGFEPSAENVTADLDCYAVYETEIRTLDEASWAIISKVSADGTAQNYFSVGDVKMIHIQGKVGTLTVNGDYGVYIIGFDHNSEIEGNGIHFGTFKKADGTDIALVCANNDKGSTDGTKNFNMNHWGESNYGGWAGCDLRYDVLGSTDVAPSGYGAATTSGRTGYDATPTCATNPVANTLMAALPSDLRAVMKPLNKYSNNAGGLQSAPNYKWTFSTDYLPLLERVEISGSGTVSINLKQYAYFAAGRSTIKYIDSENGEACMWFMRSALTILENAFEITKRDGATNGYSTTTNARGIAPIFKV